MGSDGRPTHGPEPEEFLGSPPHVAAVAALAWLDELDARVEASTGSRLGEIAPMGFSQGGAMVTSLLRLRPERFACGVICSGFVAPGAHEADAALARVRPPVFWGRDEADPMIAPSRAAALGVWATAHTELEARLYDGILHGIGEAELADISVFLRRHLDGAVR